jgi:hypothetical protein
MTCLRLVCLHLLVCDVFLFSCHSTAPVRGDRRHRQMQRCVCLCHLSPWHGEPKRCFCLCHLSPWPASRLAHLTDCTSHSALSSGSAVAVAPNLVVSVAVAGPWVAARVVSFSAGVAAAKSSARAPSLPSSQSLEAGEAVSWERQLLARPVGVAIKSAAGGTSVPVAMSGAVDVFDRLVPGCRSFSSLNLSRCPMLSR